MNDPLFGRPLVAPMTDDLPEAVTTDLPGPPDNCGCHECQPGDVVARAEAALEGTTPAPWVVNTEGWAVISHESDSVFHGYFDGYCNDCGDNVVDAAFVAISIEDAEFIAAARSLVPELVDEVKKARTYKSLPIDMVWQDYYSPDDVCKIREENEVEVERLRGALETIRSIASRAAINEGHIISSWARRDLLDILAVIERTEQP